MPIKRLVMKSEVTRLIRANRPSRCPTKFPG